MSRWKKYQERSKDYPPAPILMEAIKHVPARKRALDFGAGALSDSKYLVSQGFERVVAVDGEFHVPHLSDNISYIEGKFEEVHFLSEWFDLINAQAALPFIQLEHFPRIWRELYDALVPGGIFAGQFFGIRSEPKIEDANYFCNEHVDILLRPYKVLKLQEREFDENGRFWQVYNFIARK